jgi:hypothetical protein
MLMQSDYYILNRFSEKRVYGSSGFVEGPFFPTQQLRNLNLPMREEIHPRAGRIQKSPSTVSSKCHVLISDQNEWECNGFRVINRGALTFGTMKERNMTEGYIQEAVSYCTLKS